MIRKTVVFLQIILYLISFNTSGQSNNLSYDLIKKAFLNPPDEARPKVYWWCLMMNQKSVLNWNKMMVTN